MQTRNGNKILILNHYLVKNALFICTNQNLLKVIYCLANNYGVFDWQV